MIFRRNEPFRFTFSPSLPCEIEIKPESDENNHYLIQAQLIDVSYNGAKIETLQDLPILNETNVILLAVTIATQKIYIPCTIKWKRSSYQGIYTIGLRCDNNDIEKRKIKQEIISYKKMNKIDKDARKLW